MKQDFNAGTAPAGTRMVTIPAHTARVFDAMSYREDGMAGRLTNVSEAYVQSQYYFDTNIPEQTIAFTDWNKLPWNMADDTKALLKRVMAEEDRKAQELLKDRIVLSKVLRLKSPGA